MSDIALDLNHDIDVTGNDITIITGAEEVRQRLIQNLRSFKGNWFLNLLHGVPYFEDIFKKNYDIEVINSILKDVILNTPGVLELLSFELNIDDTLRIMTLTFDVKTIEETITISEELI